MLHDVIFLDIKNINNGFKDYIIKKHLIKRGVKKSKNIYTVSNFTKERIINYYPKQKNKIKIIYADVSKGFKNYDKSYSKEDYVIYVGNIKENKGLKYLIEAFKDINNYKLVIVGNKDKFRSSDKSVLNIDNPDINFTGYISDDELKEKIAKAKFLIQPSTYEGFGLPPLEAMYLGTKVIMSDIDVFKEIYKDFDVIYFKNKDSLDLKNKILNSNYNLSFDKNLALNKFSHKNNAIEIEKNF